MTNISELWTPCFDVSDGFTIQQVMEEVSETMVDTYGIKPIFAFSDNIVAVRNAILYSAECHMFRGVSYTLIVSPESFEFRDGQGNRIDVISTVDHPAKMKTKNVYESLVAMVSSERTRDFNEFITIGRCIKSLFSHGGYRFWKEMTIHFRQHECHEHWQDLQPLPSSLKILMRYAETDDPSTFETWSANNFAANIAKTLEITSTKVDIAYLIHETYPDKFITINECSNTKAWFAFNGNYYKRLSGDFTIRNFIDTEILSVYKVTFPSLSDDEAAKCLSIISWLGTEGGKSEMVSSLYRLYCKSQNEMKKASTDVFVFEDCVFDLKTYEFRKGRPEELIISSTGYEFLDIVEEMKDYGDDWRSHPSISLIKNDILKKTIRSKEKRKFLTRQLAATINSKQSDKRGIMLSGPNNNGKTYLMTLYRRALGSDYAPVCPPTLFFSAYKGSGDASPQYELLKGKLCIQSEVDDTMLMNESLFKTVTGGCEEITFRKLYANEYGSFSPSCLVVIICNTYPKFDGSSTAIANRLINVVLDSVFISQASAEMETINSFSSEEEKAKYMEENNLFFADLHLEEKINDVYRYMMFYMIQTYIKYKKQGKHVHSEEIPFEIKMDTKSLFQDRNNYFKFVKACIRKSPNPDSMVEQSALYERFKHWFKISVNMRETPPALDAFITGMAKLRFVAEVSDGGLHVYKGISVQEIR